MPQQVMENMLESFMKAADREKYINAAAYQYFRDVADGDYIMARSAYFMLLVPQFFHSAQQAIEKYMKCILVLRRVDTQPFGHDLEALLNRIDEFQNIFISETSRKLILEVNRVKLKYFETSYCIFGYECAMFDKSVWELRRYCADSNYISDADKAFLDLDLNNKDTITRIVQRAVTGKDLLFSGGKLEKILSNPEDPSRKNLTSDNAFFGDSRDTKVGGIPYWVLAENTLLHVVHDEKLYHELCKYIKMPKKSDIFNVAKINNIVASQEIEFCNGSNKEEKALRLRHKLLSKVFAADTSHATEVKPV